MVKKEALSGEDVAFLNQAYGSLEEAEKKLEEAYRKNKPEQFKSVKEFILKIQRKMGEVL